MTLPSPPPGAPTWLPWVLFAVAVAVAVAKVRSDNAGTRKARAETAKTDLERAKLAIEILSESEAAQQALLTEVSQALATHASPRLSAEDLARLEQRPDVRAGAIQHSVARQNAREQLPGVLQNLEAVRQRRVSLEREVQAGVKPGDVRIDDLRTSLHEIYTQVSSIVKELAESPRIFTTNDEPENSKDGDIWYRPMQPPPPKPDSSAAPSS